MAKIGKIELYGTIYNWSSRNSGESFALRFADACAGMESVNLHIHCYGGDVIEGNFIYNTIKKSKIPVDVYVDGVAASMGSVIMLAARKVYMAENALIMIHAPSGYAEGTASDFTNQAKVLGIMEADFRKVYAKKTGKTEKEVAKWLVGDNWFGATEALAEGLVDGISDEVITVNALTAELKTTKDIKAVWEAYSGEGSKVVVNKKQVKEMNKGELISKYALTGVSEASSDAEVYAALDAKLNAGNVAAQEAVAKLEAERKRVIGVAVAQAIADRKITAAQKEQFESIGALAGIEALEATFGAIKPQVSIMGSLAGAGSTGAGVAGKESWTWDEWQKKDANGLVALEKSDKVAFDALFEAKYGSKRA